jgi:hypothetical protein
MNITDIVTKCFTDTVMCMGQTYDSIVWKNISEDEYNSLSDEDKKSYSLNESSYEGGEPKYTLNQLVIADGTIVYHELLSKDEYEQLDDEVKKNFKLAKKMYSLAPISLKDMEDQYKKYISETEPMIRLREKRDTLLQETDKYLSIPDWPHHSEEIKQQWINYRQALRDLPTNTPNPQFLNGVLMNVVWPTPPP